MGMYASVLLLLRNVFKQHIIMLVLKLTLDGQSSQQKDNIVLISQIRHQALKNITNLSANKSVP